MLHIWRALRGGGFANYTSRGAPAVCGFGQADKRPALTIDTAWNASAAAGVVDHAALLHDIRQATPSRRGWLAVTSRADRSLINRPRYFSANEMDTEATWLSMPCERDGERRYGGFLPSSLHEAVMIGARKLSVKTGVIGQRLYAGAWVRAARCIRLGARQAVDEFRAYTACASD